MIMTIGGDAHKRTHTFVVADPTGRELAERTFATTTEGHRAALGWAAQWPDERDLLGAGERVVRVPTQLMAGARAAVGTRGLPTGDAPTSPEHSHPGEQRLIQPDRRDCADPVGVINQRFAEHDDGVHDGVPDLRVG